MRSAHQATAVGPAIWAPSYRGSLYLCDTHNKMAQSGMEAEIPGQVVEDLLTSFLSAALGLELHVSIDTLERLPLNHRDRLQAVAVERIIWVAWQTNLGVVLPTARYHHQHSRRMTAHAMLIEWWIPPDTHHAGWWRANPKRPTEWTAGRSHLLASTLSNEKL